MPKVVEAQGILEIIGNIDRPAEAFADGPYADTDTQANGENEPGKRMAMPPGKHKAIAEAGVGRAGAAWSIFSAEARGPNASAEAEANGLEAGAMARAELGSLAAAAGPVEAKLGVGIDTGIKIGPTKVELKVLGTGVTLGSTMGVSFFGSEIKLKFF